MFSRDAPTLTGLSTSTEFALLTASTVGIGTYPVGGNALTVAGNTGLNGSLDCVGFTGNCISSSLAANDLTVAASTAGLHSVYALAGNALPTSGGTVTGALTVIGTLFASNVSVLGGFETVRAFETHSSNLVIDNGGTGPALKVTQAEGGPLGAQSVAEFYSGAGTVALVIDNQGNLAVNKPSAGFELDVSGVVCAVGLSGCITDSTSKTSSSLAASATAVKSAYDLASAAVPSTGGVVSGTLAVGKPSVDLGYCVDVSGIVRASAFQLVSGLAIGGGGGTNYWDVSGTSIWAHAGSNVGVGRPPTGTYALDVSGGLNVSGTTKHLGAVGIGKDPSGCSLDVSGSVNVSTYLQAGHCAFFVFSNSGSTSMNPINYSSVQFNIGSCYSTSTFKFTAPVTGVYSFSASAMPSSGSLLWLQSSSYTGNIGAIRNQGANADHICVSSVVRLSAGDTVYPAANSGSVNVNDSFSGALLFACT